MAVFVTAFSWILVFWLDSHSSWRVRIRLDNAEDPKPVFGMVQSLLVSHKCRLQSSALYEDKGQMVQYRFIPRLIATPRFQDDAGSFARVRDGANRGE
jgi:hypothetical protein